jgi:hypothetical protein
MLSRCPNLILALIVILSSKGIAQAPGPVIQARPTTDV